eukprot:2577556-Prymnesium_polylepis.1
MLPTLPPIVTIWSRSVFWVDTTSSNWAAMAAMRSSVFEPRPPDDPPDPPPSCPCALWPPPWKG